MWTLISLLNITVTLALVTLTLCVPIEVDDDKRSVCCNMKKRTDDQFLKNGLANEDSKAVLRELLAQIKTDNRLPPSQISHNFEGYVCCNVPLPITLPPRHRRSLTFNLIDKAARHNSLSEQLAVLEAQQLQREEQAAAAALLEDDEQQQPLLQQQQLQQQQQQPDVSESFPAVGDSAVRRMVKLAASYLASKGEDAAGGYLSSSKRGFFIGPEGDNGRKSEKRTSEPAKP